MTRPFGIWPLPFSPALSLTLSPIHQPPALSPYLVGADLPAWNILQSLPSLRDVAPSTSLWMGKRHAAQAPQSTGKLVSKSVPPWPQSQAGTACLLAHSPWLRLRVTAGWESPAVSHPTSPDCLRLRFSWAQWEKDRVRMLSFPLRCCVTLSKLLNLSEPLLSPI